MHIDTACKFLMGELVFSFPFDCRDDDCAVERDLTLLARQDTPQFARLGVMTSLKFPDELTCQFVSVEYDTVLCNSILQWTSSAQSPKSVCPEREYSSLSIKV